MAGNPSTNLDYFLNAGTNSASKVQFEAWVTVERRDRQHMGIGQVVNVYVVANAGTVLGRIVVT